MNELFYVGEGRPNRAYSSSSRNIYWKEMVKKHNGFVVKIVEKNITKLCAGEIETKLIKYYRDSGFKLTNVCSGPLLISSVGMPNERLSEWNRIHCGELSPTFGIKRPDLTERNKSGNFKRFVRSVICVETGEIYNSIKEVKKAFNKLTTNTEINKHLGGYRKRAYGYTWKKIEK